MTAYEYQKRSEKGQRLQTSLQPDHTNQCYQQSPSSPARQPIALTTQSSHSSPIELDIRPDIDPQLQQERRAELDEHRPHHYHHLHHHEQQQFMQSSNTLHSASSDSGVAFIIPAGPQNGSEDDPTTPIYRLEENSTAVLCPGCGHKENTRIKHTVGGKTQ
jgi:hypothetical protein